MNRSETAQMLTAMAALDRRTLGEADVIAWQGMVSDVSLADGLEAVQRHYAEHTEWMMPAHVRRLVRDIVREREALATATGWAPGQYGIPAADVLPEISGPIDESTIAPSVRALLEATRAMLPEGSREALMPRRVAWEREHQAHVRVKDGTPNPLYRPAEERECVVDGDGLCQTHDRHVSSCPASGRGPVADEPKVACDWHTEGGYGWTWDCRNCNPDHPAYKATGEQE